MSTVLETTESILTFEKEKKKNINNQKVHGIELMCQRYVQRDISINIGGDTRNRRQIFLPASKIGSQAPMLSAWMVFCKRREKKNP